VTDVWSALIRSTGDIASARFESSSALRMAGYPQRLVDDVALIITELGVNALQHGGAEAVHVQVGAGDARNVEVRVSHDENVEEFLVDEPPVMASSDQLVGRGRAIVAALSRRFETTVTPSRRVVHLAVVDA